MSAALQQPSVHMTLDAFLAWEPPDGERFQLIDGEVVAMSPPTEPHARTHAEIVRLIGKHLVEHAKPCAVLVAPGIQPRVRSQNNVRIPDIVVTSAPPVATAKLASQPVIAIEIISPSNERETWTNVWAYTTIPSVREILCVRLDEVCVELIVRRADGGWPDDPERITDGAVGLPSIGFACDVAAFYRTSHLARSA